eukprot:2031008-Ditylum_brightwellii.AAC.1
MIVLWVAVFGCVLAGCWDGSRGDKVPYQVGVGVGVGLSCASRGGAFSEDWRGWDQEEGNLHLAWVYPVHQEKELPLVMDLVGGNVFVGS